MVLWVPGERLLTANTPTAPVSLQPGHRGHRGGLESSEDLWCTGSRSFIVQLMHASGL